MNKLWLSNGDVPVQDRDPKQTDTIPCLYWHVVPCGRGTDDQWWEKTFIACQIETETGFQDPWPPSLGDVCSEFSECPVSGRDLLCRELHWRNGIAKKIWKVGLAISCFQSSCSLWHNRLSDTTTIFILFFSTLAICILNEFTVMEVDQSAIIDSHSF